MHIDAHKYTIIVDVYKIIKRIKVIIHNLLHF